MAARPRSAEVNVARILAGAGCIVGTVVLALLASRGLIEMLGGHLSDRVPERPPVPSPILESQPEEDFASYQRMERRRLSSYGWIDRRAGKVRIPIELAMRALSRERAESDETARPSGGGAD